MHDAQSSHQQLNESLSIGDIFRTWRVLVHGVFRVFREAKGSIFILLRV